MHLYEDQFSEKHDFDANEKPSKVLIIASTGRCGSHMLGHALHSTGRFGFPLEYANPANIEEWKKRLGVDSLSEVITRLQSRRTSSNGVFAIKIHYPHIKQFGGFENLIKQFPNAHYVLLSREDVLNQAVSLSVASQTGVWISGQQPTSDSAVYDYNHINSCLRETILNNASWRYKLAASGCNYIEMSFQDVQKDLSSSIKRVANFMNVEIADSEIPSQQVTKKQSNQRNRDWAERFAREFKLSNELLDHSSGSLIHRLFSKVKSLM